MSYKEEALNFLGITRWHELGYTGKGIKIMSDEKVYEKEHPDVISPKGVKSKKDHGDDVMLHIKLVAPDAEFIAFPLSVNSDKKGGYISPCADYIKNNGVHIFTTSCSAGNILKHKEMAMQDCIDKGCIFFGACGNDDKKGVRREIKSEKYLAIGGVKPKFLGEYDENEEAIYEVFSVYKIEVEDYYITTNFKDTEFSKFIKTIKERSINDFNVKVTEKDSVLTLSTCDNDNKYRIVLHAKKVL
jgi:hypothetical protein